MKNFTLSLYAFHLCQSFSNAPDEVDESASLLWENLAQLGDSVLPFHGLKNLRSHLLCYTNNTYDPTKEAGQKTFKLTNIDCLELGSIPTTEGFQIHSNLQAFRLHDTYAADLTFYLDSTQEIDINQIQLFQPKSLLPATIQASLGQTLWLYGEVDSTPDDCLELAKKSAIALLAGTPLNPVLANQGSLFGSLLFEFRAIDPSYSDDSAQQCHLLICLNPQQSPTPTLVSQAYNWLLELSCCYHKIRFIYSQASQRYRDARILYTQLEKYMEDFSQSLTIADRKIRLEKYKSILTKFPGSVINYSQCLGDLQTHYTALKTNTTNYETCLKQLDKIGDTPQFWQDFLQQSRDRDRTQIQTHLDYLAPKQTTFQQAIDTIRGTVEIEQAEIDRASEDAAEKRQQTIERLIFSVSTGLAISGVSSQVIDEPVQTLRTQKPPTETQTLAEYCSYGFLDVSFHLAIGLIPAILVWRILSRIQQRQRRT